MSQEFGEISLGSFGVGSVIRLWSDVRGCSVPWRSDWVWHARCWPWMLAAGVGRWVEPQLGPSTRVPTVTSPHNLGICTAWPPGEVGARLLPWSGAKEARWEPNCIMWLSVELAASHPPHFIGYEQVIKCQPRIRGRGGRPFLSMGAGSKNPQACSKVAKQG